MHAHTPAHYLTQFSKGLKILPPHLLLIRFSIFLDECVTTVGVIPGEISSLLTW